MRRLIRQRRDADGSLTVVLPLVRLDGGSERRQGLSAAVRSETLQRTYGGVWGMPRFSVSTARGCRLKVTLRA